MSKIQLNEQLLEKAEIIKEGLPKGIIARIDYPIMRFGIKNANNRIYRREVAEAVMENENVKHKLKTRTLFGNEEHPSESQVKLDNTKTSHIISDLHINEEKQVLYATIDLLPSDAGKFINILLEAGCLVGTSTRADGELEEKVDEADGSKYNEVIPKSYSFQALDFTGDPSTVDALPENVIKAVESHYASRDIDKNVAIALLETVNTDASKKIINNIKNDKQHVGCKQSVLSKSCSTCFYAKEAVVVKESTKADQPVTKLEVNIDKQVEEFLVANRESFKDGAEALNSLIKVFKITSEKANAYIQKMAKGETPMEVEKKIVGEGKEDNVCPKCKQHSGFWYKKVGGKEVKVCAAKNCDYTEPIAEAIVPELVDDGMKDLYIQEIVKLSQELAKAQEHVEAFKSAELVKMASLSKTIEENKQLKDQLAEVDKKFQSYKMTPEKAAKLEKQLEEDEKRIAALKAENESIKESHRHELVKMYSDSRVKALGLVIPKQVNALLESCKDKDEVDRTIRSIQNSIRESIVTSASLSEITVNNTVPKDNKQVKIDKNVENAFKAFGM